MFSSWYLRKMTVLLTGWSGCFLFRVIANTSKTMTSCCLFGTLGERAESACTAVNSDELRTSHLLGRPRSQPLSFPSTPQSLLSSVSSDLFFWPQPHLVFRICSEPRQNLAASFEKSWMERQQWHTWMGKEKGVFSLFPTKRCSTGCCWGWRRDHGAKWCLRAEVLGAFFKHPF